MNVMTISTLIDGVPTETQALIDGRSESIVLLRRGEQVHAWLNRCPHAGRRLDWSPSQFLLTAQKHIICAAHGATFDLQDGQCITGPCKGKALRPIAVTVRDGQVVLMP